VKTSTILLIAAGVALVGYFAYTSGVTSGAQGQSKVDNILQGVASAW